MPAHSLDPNDPKVIARLLVALLHDHKGEIRVKAGNYDNMERLSSAQKRTHGQNHPRRTNE